MSLDELVGMESIRDKERLDALLDEANTLRLNNRLEQAISIFREILAVSPEHRDAMTQLAAVLRQRNADGDCEEAIRLYERLALRSAPPISASGAENQICLTLYQMGRKKEAAERARSLNRSYMEMCDLMSLVTDGEENVEWRQRLMTLCVMRIADNINSVTEGPRYEGEPRLKLLYKIPALFALLYDEGDFFLAYATVSRVWWRIAHLELKAGRKDAAFEALGECARLAARSDEIAGRNAVRCSSPLFDTCAASFPDKTEYGSYSGDYARAIRQMPGFDGVRGDPRSIPFLTLLDDTHAERESRKKERSAQSPADTTPG